MVVFGCLFFLFFFIQKMMKYKIITIIILLLICSCSPQKRLDRLHKNHSYLFHKVKDTIKIYDTTHIYIPGTKTDTTFISSSRTDTIILQKENFHTRLEIKGDTFYLSGGCDTIYKEIIKEIQIPTDRYDVEVNKKQSFFHYLYIGLIFLIIITFLAVLFRLK